MEVMKEGDEGVDRDRMEGMDGSWDRRVRREVGGRDRRLQEAKEKKGKVGILFFFFLFYVSLKGLTIIILFRLNLLLS